MTFIPPPVPGYIGGPEFQVWWQQAMENLAIVINDQSNTLIIVQSALQDAGIALNAAGARMPPPPPLSIVVPAGLPASTQFYRYQGGDDVSLNTEWSMAVLSGTITATIAHGTGLLTVTSLTTTSLLQVMSNRDDVPLTAFFQVIKL